MGSLSLGTGAGSFACCPGLACVCARARARPRPRSRRGASRPERGEGRERGGGPAPRRRRGEGGGAGAGPRPPRGPAPRRPPGTKGPLWVPRPGRSCSAARLRASRLRRARGEWRAGKARQPPANAFSSLQSTPDPVTQSSPGTGERRSGKWLLSAPKQHGARRLQSPVGVRSG